MSAEQALETRTAQPQTHRQGRLKNGAKPHILTEEDRAKGLQVRRQKAAERRARAEEIADAALTKSLSKAVKRYAEALDADSALIVGSGQVLHEPDHKTRIAAADRITDRVLGRPVQRTETTIEGTVEVDVEAKLLALLARHSEPQT